MQTNDLLKRISEESRNMSKGHRQIAEYIINNYDKAAYMTASKLGEVVGISESTVVRFAYAVGFEGYPEFQRSLQELMKRKLTWVQRLYLAQKTDGGTLVKNVLKSDMKNLSYLTEDLNVKTLELVSDRIIKAKNIYITGLRSSAPIAQFLFYYLNYIFENVHLVTPVTGDIFGQLMHAKKGDLVIGISFPRYSKTTLEGMAFVKNNGAEIVAITDNSDSPMAALADLCIYVKSNMNSFVDSIVAPMSIINCIIVLVGMAKRDVLIENFNRMEKTWKEFSVYGIQPEGNDQEQFE
jgi:DNA-binding MurR/RpiR family transcriptional regulator